MKISNIGVRVLVLTLTLGVALSESNYYCTYTIEDVYVNDTLYSILNRETTYSAAVNNIYGTTESAMTQGIQSGIESWYIFDLSQLPITIDQPDDADSSTGSAMTTVFLVDSDASTIAYIEWAPATPYLQITCGTDDPVIPDISAVAFEVDDDLTFSIVDQSLIITIGPTATELINLGVDTFCPTIGVTALDDQRIVSIIVSGYVGTVTVAAASSYDVSTSDRFSYMSSAYYTMYPGSYSTVATTLMDTSAPSFVINNATTDCYDVSNYYYWATATTVDECPASPENDRVVACTVPAGATTEAQCLYGANLASAACCWDDSNTDTPCRASDQYRCDLTSIDAVTASSSTIVYVEGQMYTAAIEGTYDYIYPGESVTFSCNTDTTKLFAYDSGYTPDSSTSTVVTCAIDENEDMTDIGQISQQIACTDPCITVNYDSSTQSISPEVSADNPQQWGSSYTLTCNEGYGFDNGQSVQSVQCRNSAAAVDQCYRCDAPTDNTTMMAHGSFSADSAMPAESVTFTCEQGYSLVGSTDTQTTAQCNGATGWDNDDWAGIYCIADCVLGIVLDGPYNHTGSDGYLALDQSVTLGCDFGSLPVTQEATITCNTAGENIAVEACQPLCSVSALYDSATERNLFYRDSDADDYNTIGVTTEVEYGTQLKMECTDYNSVQYSEVDSQEFACSSTYYDSDTDTWTGVPTCYGECMLSADDETLFDQITITAGSDTSVTVTWGDYVSKDTQVQITCADSTYTVKDTEFNYQTLTCDDAGTRLTPTICVASCEANDLPAVTSNTMISPDDKVGYRQNVEFSCGAGYYLGNQNGNFESDSSVVECEYVDVVQATEVQFNIFGTDYTGVSGEIPTESQCYAYPTIASAAAAGAETIDFEVTFDSARDTSVTILSVVITTNYSTTEETCTATGSDSSWTCTHTSAGNEGVGRSAKATVTYDLTYTADSTTNIFFDSVYLDNLYPGPLALDTTGSTTSVVGKDTLTIALSSAATATATVTGADTGYSVSYTIVISDSTGGVVATMTDQPLSTFTSPGTALDISSYVSTMSSYTAVITPVISSGGTGGEVTISFDTGLEGPIVTSDVIHSTEVSLTITLGGGATLTGDYDVSIDGSPETLTFTDGVATKTISGLTALQAYSYDIIVYYNSVPSPTTTSTWTQGPTEPVLGSDPTLTNAQATVTWTWVDQNTYYLNLYLQGDDGTYATDAIASYITDADTTSGSYIFTGLTAGSTYKVTAQAEMTVDSETLQSSTSNLEFTLYSCATADKVGTYNLNYVNSGNTLGDEVVSGIYLIADASTEFYVSCPSVGDVEYSLQSEIDSELDNKTACIGPNEWGTHSDCLEVTAAVSSGTSTGVITGIIIAVVLILVVIIIIVILIKRRKSTESSSTKKYSPRDEEKNNEIDDGGEAWRNPYYQEHDEKTDPEKPDVVVPIVAPDNVTPEIPEKESPDIPDNRDANGGDNISQEAQINFNDEDEQPYDEAPGSVVIANNNAEADANEQV